MSMMDWAKREVEIACKRKNPNRKEGEFDYECACYESALKALESLCKDGYSRFSIKMTQAILNRLIDGKTLTPIEDTDDIWNRCTPPGEYPETYKCKRMSSLFKYIYENGSVEYSDIERSYCVDINDSNNTYSFGFANKIIDEMFPITMPYMSNAVFKMYCEEFLMWTKKDRCFDTFGIFYALKTENGIQEKIEINRFFRTPEENEKEHWVEISKEEYYERKERQCY